jgi:methenyltetrahydromethanopterin cyclohydrolase
MRVAVSRDESGARLIDCGIHVLGGLDAGVALAEVCMSGLGHVSVTPGDPAVWPGPWITVRTDQPVAACMASQYAGWQIVGDRYFAMGSGPMRAMRGREKMLEALELHDSGDAAVGVLESGRLPTSAVCRQIAEQCSVDSENLTLLVAPTRSLAGTLQVVARSVETALHKMHELGFDLRTIVSGFGTAPLPPPSADDMAAIGRTNDSVLYGAETTLWLLGDDAELERIGPQIPSSASKDHGQPFAAIFDRYGRDFYKIDPHLFSPAVVNLFNLNSGRTYRFGTTSPDVLRRSFGP